jgi:capsule polysaccharide export protein KpsE/RkpR
VIWLALGLIILGAAVQAWRFAMLRGQLARAQAEIGQLRAARSDQALRIASLEAEAEDLVRTLEARGAAQDLAGLLAEAGDRYALEVTATEQVEVDLGEGGP